MLCTVWGDITDTGLAVKKDANITCILGGRGIYNRVLRHTKTCNRIQGRLAGGYGA